MPQLYPDSLSDAPEYSSDASASNPEEYTWNEDFVDAYDAPVNDGIDAERIQVTIKSQDVPMVLFFGPPACGKTMTLIRLTRYLKRVGYNVRPVRSLRPSSDEHYKELCNGFKGMVNAMDAAGGTSRIDFMLVEVLRKGRRICQILEAPGEHYYEPDARKRRAMTNKEDFPSYINKILSLRMRRIFCVMVEPEWADEEVRVGYVDQLRKLQVRMNPHDRTIFVFNKIDKTPFVFGSGQVHMAQARKEIADLYPGIFESFRNVHPITRFFRAWNCDFVAFQTGTYNEDAAGGSVFTEGPDAYPRQLWSKILSLCRG